MVVSPALISDYFYSAHAPSPLGYNYFGMLLFSIRQLGLDSFAMFMMRMNTVLS